MGGNVARFTLSAPCCSRGMSAWASHEAARVASIMRSLLRSQPVSDQPPPQRSSKAGFAIVRAGTGVPPSSPSPSPSLPRTTTDVGTPPPLRSGPGTAPLAPPVAYDGLLIPVAAAPARPTSPPVPVPVAPAPSAMTPEMSAALAALKRTPTSPSRSDPTSLPRTTTSSSRPGLPAWATGAGGEADARAALETPPAKKPTDRGRVLRRAAAAVGIVVVVGGGWALSGVVTGGGGAGGEVSAGGALADAVTCKQTLLRGRDLICVAPPSSLTELTPAERDARLSRAKALGIFAGMNRIIFEDNGRTWRTLVLTTPGTAPGAPSTTEPTTVPTTEPTTVPTTVSTTTTVPTTVPTPSKAAPSTGALDATPP